MNRVLMSRLLGLNIAKKEYFSARKKYRNTLMALIEKYGEIEIDDENEGNPETGDYSKRIFTMSEDKGYVYSPTFDRVRVVEDADGKHMEFRVKDGDGLFEDNSWVSTNDFADDAWEELTEYIDYRTL